MGVRDLHATPPSVQRMTSVFQFFGTSSGLTYAWTPKNGVKACARAW